MEPLSCISPCTGGAEVLAGGSMFLGRTRILFTIAHTPPDRQNWTGKRRLVPFPMDNKQRRLVPVGGGGVATETTVAEGRRVIGAPDGS